MSDADMTTGSVRKDLMQAIELAAASHRQQTMPKLEKAIQELTASLATGDTQDKSVATLRGKIAQLRNLSQDSTEDITDGEHAALHDITEWYNKQVAVSRVIDKEFAESYYRVDRARFAAMMDLLQSIRSGVTYDIDDRVTVHIPTASYETASGYNASVRAAGVIKSLSESLAASLAISHPELSRDPARISALARNEAWYKTWCEEEGLSLTDEISDRFGEQYTPEAKKALLQTHQDVHTLGDHLGTLLEVIRSTDLASS